MQPIIIIGTGLAGYSLAREFRRLDQESPLLLFTADDGRYYSKPMLSNALAQGKGADDLALNGAEQMAAQLKAEIRTGVGVEVIDPANHRLVVDGEAIEYGRLVLAVGASPFRLPLQGSGAAEVVAVNNLADYARFRERLAGAERVAIIGPGLIGCEFANDLVAGGRKVEVIGPDPWPVRALLPEEAGRAMLAGLSGAGVGFHLGTTTRSIDRAAAGYRIELENGATLKSDLVLSAVGLRPQIALAEEAGLAVNRGIVTDERLRTSDPDIFALGDCAEVAGRNLPYVMPLMTGAKALARTLAGEETAVVYPPMPVVIKTPAHAVVVLPPGPGAEWEIGGDETGVRGLARDDEGKLSGFVLTGAAVGEKQALLRQVGG